MRTSLADLLAQHDVLLADGATGTNELLPGGDESRVEGLPDAGALPGRAAAASASPTTPAPSGAGSPASRWTGTPKTPTARSARAAPLFDDPLSTWLKLCG